MNPLNSRAPVFEPLESRQLLSAGELDPTFGVGGKVQTDRGLAASPAVAVQADGKIIAAAESDGHAAFNLVRYTPDGALDPMFGGGDGVATTDVGDGWASIVALAVLPDGRIVVAGVTAGDSSFALARFNADGSLDATFGDGGVASAPPALGVRGVRAMAVQADGRIVCAVGHGADPASTDMDVALVRFNPDGRVDASFGAGGIAPVDLGGYDEAADLVIQADGKIVLGAMTYLVPASGPWENRGAFIVRFNADGTLDSTFGHAGFVGEDLGGLQGGAARLAIGMDGRIVALAYTLTARRNLQLFLVRYNDDGSTDTTFGDGGRTTLNGGETTFSNLLVQPDGKILLAGSVIKAGYEPGYGPSDVAARRFNADGTVDTTYGDAGLVRTSVEGNSDLGLAAALQQDGSLVIAGTAFHENSGQDVILLRFRGDRGAAGSRFASLRRGIDQQAEYTGKPAAHHHRSPKRRAMEQAAAAAGKRHHRSPKRRAQDLARQQAAATLSAVPASTVFNTTRAIDDEDLGILV
jgi:uncharacterized delta-60 repeat protein